MAFSMSACGDEGSKNAGSTTQAFTEAPKEIVDSELYDSFINNEAKVLFRSKKGIRTATVFNIGTALGRVNHIPLSRSSSCCRAKAICRIV